MPRERRTAGSKVLKHNLSMTHDTSHVALTLLRPVAAGALAALLALTAFHPTSAAEADTVSTIGLKLMAEGFGAPVALVSIPGGSGRLLVAGQAGVIHLLDRDSKHDLIVVDVGQDRWEEINVIL